jgi:site-specific DNA-methyltransferase (adenine-specific)
MATDSPVEKLFTFLDKGSKKLNENENMTYLDALVQTGESIFNNEDVQEIAIEDFTNEEIRKAYQLAILKGMKEAVQPNHTMTPDGVALFMGYLVNKVTEGLESFSLLDPAIGTGNLLSAILNQSPKKVQSFGVDIDETLLKLAHISMNTQKHTIELFQQDSLKPLLISPVDMVVCDLPVGYYPDDSTAKDYELRADKGYSYAHHLFIEQSIHHTREGGYLFFLIPNFLFQSEQADKLNQFFREKAVIQGLLQLPTSMFKKEEQAKSILFVRKKGEEVKPPKQALLVDLPSFKNQQSMLNIMKQLDHWFTTEFKSENNEYGV